MPFLEIELPRLETRTGRGDIRREHETGIGVESKGSVYGGANELNEPSRVQRG